ncbi:MAG: histidine phosphatase family protein [Clostridia bacterium]|nr:histidine phosphatase family protein [Clostridia bacterium]
MKVLFVRHGEPCYENVRSLNLVSYVADLTPLGVAQAENIADDDRLQDADLIVSSPFTRALQTASIISRKTQIPLAVEPHFHEWLEDTSHIFTLHPTYGNNSYKEFFDNNFERNSNCIYNWEAASHIAERAFPAMRKYYDKGYKKIIVVAHAMFMRTFGYDKQELPYCHVFEYEFDENSHYTGFTPWRSE